MKKIKKNRKKNTKQMQWKNEIKWRHTIKIFAKIMKSKKNLNIV